jgi:hypothetical protein
MAITQNNLPASQRGAAVQVDPNDPYPNVTGKPLQMPDFVDIKPKNPLLTIRWCNRVAGDGQRMDQVTYAGFRPAKPDEVVMKNGTPLQSSLVRDGKIIYGDLQAMIIPKADYDGALKYNWQRAVNRMNPNANRETGKAELKKVLNEAGVRSDLSKKLSTFQPSDAEIEAGEKASK